MCVCVFVTEGTRQSRQMVTFGSKLPWTPWLSFHSLMFPRRRSHAHHYVCVWMVKYGCLTVSEDRPHTEHFFFFFFWSTGCKVGQLQPAAIFFLSLSLLFALTILSTLRGCGRVSFGSGVNSCSRRDWVWQRWRRAFTQPHVERHRFSTKARAHGENNRRLLWQGTVWKVSAAQRSRRRAFKWTAFLKTRSTEKFGVLNRVVVDSCRPMKGEELFFFSCWRTVSKDIDGPWWIRHKVSNG